MSLFCKIRNWSLESLDDLFKEICVLSRRPRIYIMYLYDIFNSKANLVIFISFSVAYTPIGILW